MAPKVVTPSPIPGVTLVYIISGRSHNTALLNFGSRLLLKPMPVQLGKALQSLWELWHRELCWQEP